MITEMTLDDVLIYDLEIGQTVMTYEEDEFAEEDIELSWYEQYELEDIRG